MRARARLQIWAALFSAALLAAYTVFSYAAAQVASHAHEQLPGAGATHQIGPSAKKASHQEPAGHCHPGFDCLIADHLLPDRFEAPIQVPRPGRVLPSGAELSSVTMSPQPPPPRVGSVFHRTTVQT